jgi:hypothetical protein
MMGVEVGILSQNSTNQHPKKVCISPFSHETKTLNELVE